MSEKKTYCQSSFEGERALFNVNNVEIVDSIFHDGESPLKESRDIILKGSMFKWKYPLWYCKNVHMDNCTLFDTARAGIWYTDDIKVNNTVIEAPKNFRRCRGVKLSNVSFPNASETLWSCSEVNADNINVRGDYFAMNCSDMELNRLTLVGNYSFDGVKNAVIRNSTLLSRDAFWNSENITVYDSFISGEYLGWNSKNLTLVNCTVESLQGMCYIENLTMKNCKLINTNLSFEYSTVDADIISRIDSVKNPLGGVICAKGIDELIMEEDKVDVSKTKIICNGDR